MDKTAYTDEQLIAMIQSGGDARQAALKHIYFSGHDAAKKKILRRGGYDHEADDARQEAILILDNHIRNGEYEPKASLKNYYIGICYWQWIAMKGYYNRFDWQKDLADLGLEDIKTPEVLMLEGRLKELVRQLLDKEELGERCQKAVTMWSESYPLKEIAQIMNTTYGYAQQMVFDCRNKLKKILEKDPALMQQLRDLL